MRTMTIEELLRKESDSELLAIYTELDSCVVPATGYAHAYCRKVNKLIDAGRLCILPGKYRKVYLPTLSKMIFRELSRRYADVLYNEKSLALARVFSDEADSEAHTCVWCHEEFDESELRHTDFGCMCDTCITAVRSHGERVAVYD